MVIILSSPPPQASLEGLQRWLCQIMLILRVMMNQSKEEVVLSRLQELRLSMEIYRRGYSGEPQQVHTSVFQSCPNEDPEALLLVDPEDCQESGFRMAEETLAR